MTFESEFGETIKQMRAYLNKHNLNTISFHYDEGWNFKLSCPVAKWEKQSGRTIPQMFREDDE